MVKNNHSENPANPESADPLHSLSRRERQIMEVLMAREEASVAQVRRAIPEPPSYDAVRTTLRILEDKGVVRHREQGRRYVYYPVLDPAEAREAALSHLSRTFFSGSPARAALALLQRSDVELDEADLRALERKIRHAEQNEAEEDETDD